MEIDEVRNDGKKPIDYKQLYAIYQSMLENPSPKVEMSKIVIFATSLLNIDHTLSNIADDRKRHEAESQKKENKKVIQLKESKATELRRTVKSTWIKTYQILASQAKAL